MVVDGEQGGTGEPLRCITADPLNNQDLPAGAVTMDEAESSTFNAMEKKELATG